MLHYKTVAPGTLQLLKSISAVPGLAGFSLAGGTALSLQLGHRISVDIDFFGDRPFSTDEILDLLSGQRPLTIVSQSKNILILNIQNVKVDFVNYRYPLIKNYLVDDSIRLLAMEDIAAMKLAAIAGRGRKRDFCDIYFLLQKFTLMQMVGFYNQKYDDGSEMMVARSLTFFDDANADEDPRVLNQKFDWEVVQRKILLEVKKIF
jgi:predicted nucleotidyltransferase component of viral defense system